MARARGKRVGSSTVSTKVVAVMAPTPPTWRRSSGLRVALLGHLLYLLVVGSDAHRQFGDGREDGRQGRNEFSGEVEVRLGGLNTASRSEAGDRRLISPTPRTWLTKVPRVLTRAARLRRTAKSARVSGER